MPIDAVPEAWVAMPSETELSSERPTGGPYAFDFVPAMARLIGAHPGIAPAFGGLFATIMFQPSALDRREKEMVAGVAASAQDCFY